MSLSTPVLASIVGAVVAGVISAIINIISLGAQYLINEKQQKNIVRREWERETTKNIRELKRSVLSFDPSSDSVSDDLDIIDSLVNDLEDQKEIIPDQHNSIEPKLTDVVLAHERKNSDDYYSSLIEYRTELLQAVQDVEGEFDS